MAVTSTARIEALAWRLLAEPLAPLGDDVGAEVVLRVIALVEEEIARERRRGAELCRHRADLWGETAAATDPASPASARDEARARRNEALYLADLLATDAEADLYGTPDA